MSLIPVTLDTASYRPHVKLPRRKLDLLGIGNGRTALIRLTVVPGEASEAEDDSAAWLAAPVWQCEPVSAHDELATPPSRRNHTTSTTNVDGLTISSNLVPAARDGQQFEAAVYSFESIPSVASAIEVSVRRVAAVPFARAAVGAGSSSSGKSAVGVKLDGATMTLVQVLAKELLLELGVVLAHQTFTIIHQGLEVHLSAQASSNAADTLQGVRASAKASSNAADTLEEARASALAVSRATRVTVVQAKSKGRSANPPAGSQAPAIAAAPTAPTNPKLNLGGLDEEVRQMRELVFLPLMRPDLFESHNLQPPRGVLLHGPPGTGKTSLSLSVASSFLQPWQIFTISGPELSSSYHGRTEARLRKVFQRARKQDKAVIIIDEIDVIAASRDSGEGDSVGSRVVATLLTEIDGVGQEYRRRDRRSGAGKGNRSDASEEDDDDDQPSRRRTAAADRIVVIAATNRPNAIDPALRRPGRLDREIEIGVPNPAARLDILERLLQGTPNSLTPQDLDHIANRTHGFVGADLSALVREAGMRVIRRQMSDEATSSSSASGLAETTARLSLSLASNPPCVPLHLLTADDVLSALPLMRPSSLRSMIPPPPLSWTSIGLGSPTSPYALVKQSIQQTIEWPLRYSDRMRKLGISGNRGVLLYGPPGCSKTMIARACSQSEGINWIGVKGPELYSKYLGDSEKGIRELFRKARAAAPTIIFFDEIDALTTTRSAASGPDNDAVSDRVIATLLTEMDGADALEKVVIIAATNRPQVIDPALLRPGRLDTLLYVGPPDQSARRSIFELRTDQMATAPDLDLDKLALMTDGCSGAEIVSICQDAGIKAMSENIEANHVSQLHFEQAAAAVRRRITPDMVRQYESWRDQRAVL